MGLPQPGIAAACRMEKVFAVSSISAAVHPGNGKYTLLPAGHDAVFRRQRPFYFRTTEKDSREVSQVLLISLVGLVGLEPTTKRL